MNRTSLPILFFAGLLALLVAFLTLRDAPRNPSTNESTTAILPHFILGVDISYLQEDELAGATYFDDGIPRDIFDILQSHGINALRIRLFVDPRSPIGYARNMPEAFGDLPHALALARRAKAHNMAILIDLMYGDSWTSPEGAPKPAAWEDLHDDDLILAVRLYTRSVLHAFNQQGTPPAMVQVGNEITHGMLWPDGRIASKLSSGNADTDARMAAAHLEGLGHYDQLAALLKAAIAEVRAANPDAQVILHNSLGRNWDRVEEWTDNLLSRGVDFDVIGLSCYHQNADGDWKNTFDNIIKKYPDKEIVVLEYSPEKRFLNDLVHDLPVGRGLGTFIWEPLHYRQAIFDQAGVNAGAEDPATFHINRAGRFDANNFLRLYDQMAKDYK